MPDAATLGGALADDARWRGAAWEVLRPEPQPPALNMALDEVLTDRVAAGRRPPTLRFWGWSAPCVVLGRFQSVRNEVDETAAAANGIHIVRRISGGGAMFIEPEGAITWSLSAPEAMVAGLSFPQSYAFFDAWVVEALRDLGVDAWYAPLNDIASANGKIGGAAQARRNGAVLHHTTMAYAMNVPLMTSVLRIGREKLSDKGIRSADKRVGPLLAQTAMTRDAIIEHLIASFGDRYPTAVGEVAADEREEAERRVAEQFGTRAWTHILP